MSDPANGLYGLPPTGQPAPMQEGEFIPASKNVDVHFAACEIDPPSANYIDVDDSFLLTVVSNFGQQVTVNMRILRPHGRIETVSLTAQNPGAAFSTYSTFKPEREGYLLSAEAVLNSVLTAGSLVYVQLSIRRGTNININDHRVLIGDYITTTQGASWPDRPARRGPEGPGMLLSQAVSSPAAGADWSYAVPALQRLSLTMVQAQLVTSAAAATRTATLKITDGANTLALIDATTTQIASLTNQYTGYGNGFPAGSGGTHLYWPLPSPLILGPTWTIGTVTNNIQAADQWSLIRLSGLYWADYL